jgi:hypothetical protein
MARFADVGPDSSLSMVGASAQLTAALQELTPRAMRFPPPRSR